MTLKIKRNQLYFGLLFLLLLFQDAIINNTSGIVETVVSYADEFLSLFFAAYILYSLMCGERLRKNEKNLMLLGGLLLLIGTISSFVYRLQPLIPTIVDAFTCIKFILAFCGFSLFLKRQRVKFDLLDINSIIRFVVFVLFVFVVVNIFITEIFPTMSSRQIFFIKSQKLFFKHAANLADTSFFCLLILLYNDKFKNNLIYMIMASFVVVSGLRIKEIGIVILLWLMYLSFIIMKLKSKTILIAVAVLAVVIFGYDQFSYYYGNSDSARALLTSVSVTIANERFPLGAGFATFASSMSNVYYSPLYYTYNLNTVWGLGGGDYYAYISDTFWPAVIGQFGWLGVIIVLLIFAVLLKQSFSIKNDRYGFVCSLALVGFLIVFSLGGSSIFNPFSMLCAMLFACFSLKSSGGGGKNVY